MPEIPGLSREESAKLERLYKAEYNTMASFASRLLGDDMLGETAVQETFLIAARKIGDLLGSPSPEGWLYNTLKFVIKQMRRERQAAVNRFVPLEDANGVSAKPEEISGIDLNNEDVRLLKRFYVDGYSLKELAKELGISAAAVKMRLMRARRRLRDDPKMRGLKDDL